MSATQLGPTVSYLLQICERMSRLAHCQVECEPRNVGWLHREPSLWDTQKQYSCSEHLHAISECFTNYVQETSGLFFFHSLCNLFLVPFLCPCEEAIPGWSRCTRQFLAVTYQRWRTAWKINYRPRQLTSSSGRETLSGSALARQVDGAWGVPFIGHHILQTGRTRFYMFGDMWEIKPSLSSSSMHEIKARLSTAVINLLAPELFF